MTLHCKGGLNWGGYLQCFRRVPPGTTATCGLRRATQIYDFEPENWPYFRPAGGRKWDAGVRRRDLSGWNRGQGSRVQGAGKQGAGSMGRGQSPGYPGDGGIDAAGAGPEKPAGVTGMCRSICHPRPCNSSARRGQHRRQRQRSVTKHSIQCAHAYRYHFPLA